MKSSLKIHCVPGPKSPSRCMSSKHAAIPPALFHHSAARNFHLALTEPELATPALRAAIGKLAADLDDSTSTPETLERSFVDVFERVSTANGKAHAHLRQFRLDVANGKRRDDLHSGGGGDEFCAASSSTSVSGGLSHAHRPAKRKRTRSVRRSSKQVSNATVASSNDGSQNSKDGRTTTASKNATETMVQLRSQSKHIRRVRTTTTSTPKKSRKTRK